MPRNTAVWTEHDTAVDCCYDQRSGDFDFTSQRHWLAMLVSTVRTISMFAPRGHSCSPWTWCSRSCFSACFTDENGSILSANTKQQPRNCRYYSVGQVVWLRQMPTRPDNTLSVKLFGCDKCRQGPTTLTTVVMQLARRLRGCADPATSNPSGLRLVVHRSRLRSTVCHCAELPVHGNHRP